MKRALLLCTATSTLVVLGFAALPAGAQATGGNKDGTNNSTDPAAGAAPKVRVERTASGAKIFRIEQGIVVEGRIQKPNAFYVLQRSSIDYDWETLKQDFLPRIIDATSKNPF